MKYSEILRAKRLAFIDAGKALVALAETEKRELTADENGAIAKSIADAESLDVSITMHEKREGMEATAAAPRARKTEDSTSLSTGLREKALDNPTRGYDGAGGFGQFAVDVRQFNSGQGMPEGLKILAAAGDGMSAGIKADGGVLLPPAFSTNILDLVGMDSDPLLSEIDQLPPLPDYCESMTYPATNETSRADGSRKGGIQGYWKAELTQMTESKPKLKDITFSPQELYVFVYASDKLLKHAPSLSSFISSAAADEINFKIGDSIINGTGSGMPRGVLTGATDKPRVQVSKQTGQAAATVVTENFEKMYARMPARFLAGAKWYINQDVLPALFGMTKAVGTGGSAVFMPGMNISGAPYGTIYGLPIRPIEYCATLGTEGDVIFANMKQYGFQGRGGVDTGMSIHLKFDFNQTAFRFIFEADGQPWNISSITPYKGTATQSPIVTLGTRS